MMLVVSRKRAFRIALGLLWFATGTSRIGIVVEGDRIRFLGKNLIKENS